MFALQAMDLLSPFTAFFWLPHPQSIPMSFAFRTLRKTLEPCTEPQKIEVRHRKGDRKHLHKQQANCGSTVETHLLLAGYPIEVLGGIRLWVTSSVQDFQTSNVS